MIRIYINEEEVVCENGFEIKEEYLTTSSVILNKVFPKSWKGTNKLLTEYYTPEDYSHCKILNDTDLIFCGYVKNSGDIDLDPKLPKYATIQVVDYKMLLSEGKTLDFVISNKTILEAIQLVIDEVEDYGFEIGTINISNSSEIIGAYSTLDKTAYDVFQYLAEISNSTWTTRNIDEDTTAIDFIDPDLKTNVDDLEYSTDYFENNNIESLKYSFSTNDYRNKQIILSDEVFGNIDQEESFLGDDYNKKFITVEKIGLINSIEVNGTTKKIATQEQKDLGIYADFYYKAGENSFKSNEDIASISAGDVISINYTPLIKGRETIYNYAEINRIRTQNSRTGYIERYESRNDVNNLDQLSEVGNTYLKYNSETEIILTLINRDVDLFNVGDKTYFDINISKLAKNYMVKSKTMKIRHHDTTPYIIYQYELISNYNMEKDVNFFDNQRRKTTGNIGESEYITRNIDIENIATIEFNNQSINEITAPIGDNILDCILDSPLNN